MPKNAGVQTSLATSSPSSTNSNQPILLTYLPVLHQGYKQWLDRHANASVLYIFGSEIIAEFDHLKRKDIRALPPELIAKSLQVWNLPFPVEILSKSELTKLNSPQITIIAPAEDELKALAEKSLSHANIEFEPIWLRWDRSQSTKPKDVTADSQISSEKFDQEMMAAASEQAGLSSDWWRQVGAVLVKDGQVLLAGYNQHVPHPQMPYVNGDPRGNFHKGEFFELSTALHAEAGLIAEAARRGLALDGSGLYVTTFPCPVCAKQIAFAGIKKVYFSDGYALLDGESILKSQGVEIIRISNN